jgi:hypothetical protein
MSSYDVHHRWSKYIFIPPLLKDACTSEDMGKLNAYLDKYECTPYLVIMAACEFAPLGMLNRIAAKRPEVSRSVFEASISGRQRVQDVYFIRGQKFEASRMYITPFLWACEHGRIDLAKWIFEKYSVNLHSQLTDTFGNHRDAMYFACARGDLELVNWLLSVGYSVFSDGESTESLGTLQGLIRMTRRMEFYEVASILEAEMLEKFKVSIPKYEDDE